MQIHLESIPLLGGPHVLGWDIVEGRVHARVIVRVIRTRLRVGLEHAQGGHGDALAEPLRLAFASSSTVQKFD